MRGILGFSAYLPYRRLDRADIAPFIGQGGGKGTRTVASFDEDPTTIGVEAARGALRGTGAQPGAQPGAQIGVSPEVLLFGTSFPAYADKTNATAVHAALRLGAASAAFDLGASARSAVGGLLLGLTGTTSTLAVSADIRTGLPGGADEAAGGDAGAAFVVGSDADGTVLAEFLGSASVTDEFVERWRAPGETRTRIWDERFSEVVYTPLGVAAWNAALERTGLTASDVALAAVAGPTARVARGVAGKLDGVQVIDDLSGTVGNAGAAHAGLLLVSLLEQAAPGQVVALVSCNDGADVLLFRATAALAARTSTRTVAAQIANGGPVSYRKFLSWRGALTIEPPRRPEPSRVSSPAAARAEQWKFGFVGSKERDTGVVHLPPARVSRDGMHTDEMDPAPLADVQGTIATFTIDRLAYSPSPPIVFAVVDFDGGGRMPIELTDVDEAEVQIGGRVEMSFRRLGSSDGIVNYFWKGRPVRDG